MRAILVITSSSVSSGGEPRSPAAAAGVADMKPDRATYGIRIGTVLATAKDSRL
jgi:hypothetical protein